MSPLTLRRYLLDSRPVTWWDLDPVNEPDVMADIDALEPGQAVTLGTQAISIRYHLGRSEHSAMVTIT